MKRYIVRGAWEDGGDENLSRSMTVHASEPEIVETGLVDQNGDAICTQWAPEPVGFHLAQWGYQMGCKKGKGGKKK